MISTSRGTVPLARAVILTFWVTVVGLIVLGVWSRTSIWYRGRTPESASPSTAEPEEPPVQSPPSSMTPGRTPSNTDRPFPKRPPQAPPMKAASPADSPSEPIDLRSARSAAPPVSRTSPAVDSSPTPRRPLSQQIPPSGSLPRTATSTASAEKQRSEAAEVKGPVPAVTGNLRVTSAYDIDLTLNGSPVFSGKEGYVSVPVGRYQLTLSSPSVFLQTTRLIEVAEGATIDVRTPELASRGVGATPRDADILVNGRQIGRGFATLSAPAGSYVVVFRWADTGTELRRTIEVRKGMAPVYVNKGER